MKQKFERPKAILTIAAACVSVLVLSACGQSAEEQAVKKATENAKQAAVELEKAAKRLEDANKAAQAAGKPADPAAQVAAAGDLLKAMGAGSTDNLVDFRELKALLPEELLGMKRTASEGSKGGIMGIGASTAKSVYKDEKGGKSLEAEIADIGGLGGFAGMAFAWTNLDIDTENEQGYERTIKLGNRKGFEKFTKAGKLGELDVIVNNRYIVSVKSTGMDAKELKVALEKIDLAKLEAIKPPQAAAK